MSIRIVYFVFFLSACFSCDKTDCPYVDKRLCDEAYRDSLASDTSDVHGSIGSDTGTVVNGSVFYEPSVFENYEKSVLLEDFTGFRCSNCGTALVTGANLKDQFGERLVLVGLHVFFEFAAPIANPPAPFSTDFRTIEGTAYAADYNVPALPNGMIDRRDFGTGEIQSVGNWSERVSELLQEEPKAFLRFRDVAVSADSSTITFQLAISPMAQLNGAYNFTIGILEDNIVEAQKDGTETLYPYIHNHVFRGNVNGVYGQEAFNATNVFEPNTAKLFSFTHAISSAWKSENCHLFAYLHDADTREIIQCAEVPFIP